MSALSIVRTRGFLVAVLVAALAAGLAGCAKPEAKDAAYHCPMHPDYVSDRPGDCPICGMRLVPIEAKKTTEAGKTGATPGRAEATVYTCPMHPEVRDTKPGKCPECGMDLEPVAAAQADPHAGHGGGPPAADVAAGQEAGGLALSGDQVRLAGVRTAAATAGTLAHTIRAVGTVEADQARIRQVTTKVSGFVEKLHVGAEGEAVRAGQPLFDLYSPELLASQHEYLRARETAARFAASSVDEVRRGGADLASSARRRLELFDVPADFLDRLEKTGTPQRTITFRAPFSGFVTAKNVLEGQKVEPGMDLLTLSDLSRVWVTAQVYESEAPAARVGRAARVTLPGGDGSPLKGRVALVYPTLDVETRTLRLRLEFPNPRMALKPGMYVDVELAVSQARGVIVPDSAVIDSGTRQVVFVEPSPGRFEPRQVLIGVRADGQALVASGLKEGERVATAANFLLDSESRLREAVSSLSGGEHKHAP